MADPERTDPLRQPAAERPEEDERQREQRDPEVGDPVRGVQVVEHEHPQRVERADHHEHGRTEHSAPTSARERSRSNANRGRWRLAAGSDSSTRTRMITGGSRRVATAITRNGAAMPNGDQHRRDRRADREPGDVGGEQHADVAAEVIGIGEDHDPADRRRGDAGADAHHEAPAASTTTVSPNAIASRPTRLNDHPDVDEPTGVTAVGERREEDLGDERREEPDRDDHAERSCRRCRTRRGSRRAP